MKATVKLLRGFVAALLLAVSAAPSADAAWWPRRESASRPTGTASPAPRGDPMRGAAMIAAGVALLVFLAWLAVRIGESDRPADKVPN